MKRWVFCAAAALALCAPLRSAEIEGVRFSDSVKAGKTELVLNGVGLLRYKRILKGYVAALYLGHGVASADLFKDVPKRLELQYFWDIKGTAFGKAGEEVLAENISPEEFKKLRARLDRMNQLYVDIKTGDRYALTYVPGQGLELSHNGKALGVIEGADFAAAYFSIWLGQKPLNLALKSQLLGQHL
jgi:hypothetical protein